MSIEIWSDLHHGIYKDARGRLKKVNNIDSVKTSITNILTTNQGERVFLPEFASNLKSMLFEPLNNRLLNRIARNVKDTIERWDDRVDVIGVNIKAEEDNNYVEIIIEFNVKSYTETFTHSTIISR